ncbi:MAG: HEAT repeat domain-containing protein [Deltaproteobacteria bacterium]|nr:HEAT repeat domain-containing protein [Deltaproteobacteria bacterium]
MPRVWILVAFVISATSAYGSPAGSEPIRARLLEAIAQDPSIKLRALAAKRLGELSPERPDRVVEDALIEALNDHSPLVRAMAARALGERSAQRGRPALMNLAARDSDEVVQDEVSRAIARLVPSAPAPVQLERRRTVELGQVELSEGTTAEEAQALQASLRDLVETQLEPHLPALFPREDPGYRLNVRVRRDRIAGDRGVEIRCEVSVLVVELPNAHLRHAAQARASGTSRGRGPRHLTDLETKVAKEATHVAVREALASLMAR